MPSMEPGKNANWQEQYKDTHRFESTGGFMALKRLTHEGGEEHQTIVLIPGWCESFTLLRPIALDFAERGYNVIVIDYRELDNLQSINGDFKDLPSEIPKNEYAKALALVHFLEKQKVEVSIVAHSEGAVIGALAVEMRPQLFKKFVLVNPAGILEERSFGWLALRFMYSVYRQYLRNKNSKRKVQMRYVGSVLKNFFSNPLQSLSDGFALYNHRILTVLHKLSSQGIPIIYIILYKHDALFPVSKMRDACKSIEVENVIECDGGHNELFVRPKKFTQLITNIIT